MITVSRDSKGIYCVTQTIYSFTDTEVTNWYYDLVNNLVSERADFPEGLYTDTISAHQLEWFNKYHLPKCK